MDAGDEVDREALELAMTDAPFDRGDVGLRDRAEPALRSLRDHRGQRAAWLQPRVGPLRITGQKSAVSTEQRVKASWAVADERIELLEILRQHGDGGHAVERAIRRRPAPGENKERRTETCQPRRENIADIGTDIAGHVHVEEASLARVKVARYSPQLTGNERPPVPIDEKDRPHLRQRVDDELHPPVKVHLVPTYGVVGHAPHDLVDFGYSALDRLKDLKRMLVKDIERARDPVIGDGMVMTDL